jgi:hypothetical protein
MMRAGRGARTTDGGDVRKLVSTAGLLLIDAMIFNEIIASEHPEVKTLSALKGSSNLKKELEDSWQYIIDNINYEPILEIALRILRNLPAAPSLNHHLRSLLDVAYDVASSRVLLRHDLFGRIYHTLLLGNLVKYYATLYTRRYRPPGSWRGFWFLSLPSSIPGASRRLITGSPSGSSTSPADQARSFPQSTRSWTPEPEANARTRTRRSSTGTSLRRACGGSMCCSMPYIWLLRCSSSITPYR